MIHLPDPTRSPAGPTPDRRPTDSGFTLVELLVVIGIIALLISILLPALNSARRAGHVVKCLSNVRQLAMATTNYIAENKGSLPEAMYNNKSIISPRAAGAASWTPLSATSSVYVAAFPNTSVLPSIGELLAPFVSKDGRGVWECPTGFEGKDSFTWVGPDPMTGTAAPSEWLPNYYYMANKLYLPFSVPSVAATRVKSPDGVAAPFNAADWTVRNIGGMKATKCRSITNQGASEIVIFAEYKSFFHTTVFRDVYQLRDGEKQKYAGNFAFLDGHAETRRYNDRDGYMSVQHAPIRQTWYGVDFAQAFPEQYDPANLYPKTNN